MASTARLRSAAGSVYSSAQRPVLCRGRDVRPLPCPARRLGSISERRLSKPSAVISPPATSSHSAVSISAFSLPGAAHDVGEERCSPLAQEVQHLTRAFAQAAGLGLIYVNPARSHPVGLFAHEECDRRHAGRNHAPFPSRGVIERGRMRRKPSPADGAGQAELVEPGGIVVGDAPGENLPLPGIGGNFESLQLPQHIQRGAFARHLRCWRDMLPAQQPAHELRRRDRLNLLAQRGDGQPVNPRQQAPLAPFVLVWRGRPRPRGSVGEVSPQNGAGGFHPQQSFLDLGAGKSEQACQAAKPWPDQGATSSR